MSSSLRFTTAAYERSHMRRPRGRGHWLLQRSARATAFDQDLFGEMFAHEGTLTEAKAALRESGAIGLWAVLP